LIASACAPSDLRDQRENESKLDEVQDALNDTNSGSVSLGDDFVPVHADPYDYMANDLSKFVKVGQYRGLIVTKKSTAVTDDEFEEEIENLLDKYSYYDRITDRSIVEGDTVVADYAGYLNGVAFSGGTANEQEIVASANSGYIPGFAEAFVGHKPGEEFSFNVTFPSDYGNAELAGKEVTFKCKIHAILGTTLIRPELNDGFVKEKFGYNNVDEFLISYRRTVEMRKETNVNMEVYNEIWGQVLATSTVISYPGQELDRLYTQSREYYEQYAEMYETDYKTFVSMYMGTTDEAIYEKCKTYVKEELVMYQIIKELNVTLTDEAYNEGVKELAEYYMLTVDEFLNYYSEDDVRDTLLWQELMENIVTYTVINKE